MLGRLACGSRGRADGPRLPRGCGVVLSILLFGALTTAGMAEYGTINRPDYQGAFTDDHRAKVRIRLTSPDFERGDAILFQARHLIRDCSNGQTGRATLVPVVVDRVNRHVFHLRDVSVQPDFDFHEVYEVRARFLPDDTVRGFLDIRSSECSTDGRLRWRAFAARR